MLKRIYLHNFRSFVNFEWVPPPASVLVGDNGSGKSALIEVLWLLQDLVVRGATVEETTSPSARTAWLSDVEQTFEIDLERLGDSFGYRLVVRAEGGHSAVQEELWGAGALLYKAAAGKVELYGDVPTGTARTSIPFDRRRSFLSALEAQPDNTRLIAFREALASIWHEPRLQPARRRSSRPSARPPPHPPR